MNAITFQSILKFPLAAQKYIFLQALTLRICPIQEQVYVLRYCISPTQKQIGTNMIVQMLFMNNPD